MLRAKIQSALLAAGAATALGSAAPGALQAAEKAMFSAGNVGTAIGHHYWTWLPEILSPRPAVSCGGPDPGDLIESGTAFTVVDAVDGGKYFPAIYARIRLDDGRTGFIPPGSWYSEDPKAAAQTPDAFKSREEAANREAARWLAERAKKEAREAEEGRKFCQGKPSIRVGMTESQALASKWGMPHTHNTTETAAGKREQWVYLGGPACKEDGNANKYGNDGYLYFEDGRLVAIQR